MQQTAAAQTKTARPRKPAYAPIPQCVDQARTIYEIPSEKYVYLLYTVDLRTPSCDCEGFAVWGKVCKHIRICRAHHDATLAAEAAQLAATPRRNQWDRCPHCGTQYYGPLGIGEWTCSCRLTGKPAPHAGGAAGLLAAFGIE